MKRWKSWFKNYYFIAGLGFVAWLLFFDANDLYTQVRQTSKLNKLKAEKDYYTEKIIEVKADREELLSNDEMLEKFAREKYLMKKPTEDLYVVIEK